MLFELDLLGHPHMNTRKITGPDWKIIAAAGVRILPSFEHVIPATPNAKKLCEAFMPYRTYKVRKFLIVDDVWRSDNSMRTKALIYLREHRQYIDWIGFVAFCTDNGGHRGPQIKTFMQMMA